MSDGATSTVLSMIIAGLAGWSVKQIVLYIREMK